MGVSPPQNEPWGLRWRSSTYFIVATMSVALLTGKITDQHNQIDLAHPPIDMYLYGFVVPLLPYMLEHRLGLDESLTQRISTAFLSEVALILVVVSPVIGSHADRSGAKREWLLGGLACALLGSLIIAFAASGWSSQYTEVSITGHGFTYV